MSVIEPQSDYVGEIRHAAAAVFERFDLNDTSSLQLPIIAPNAVLVFCGIDNTGGDGYDHIGWLDDEVTGFRAAEAAREHHTPENIPPFVCVHDVGDWPLVVEAFKVYDPKHNPPGDDNMCRDFIVLRLVRIEGEIYLCAYATKRDAMADAHAMTARLDPGDDDA